MQLSREVIDLLNSIEQSSLSETNFVFPGFLLTYPDERVRKASDQGRQAAQTDAGTFRHTLFDVHNVRRRSERAVRNGDT